MTIKELYEKAVEGGYENLPLYDRVYSIYESHVDMEIDIVSIQVENDRVIIV